MAARPSRDSDVDRSRPERHGSFGRAALRAAALLAAGCALACGAGSGLRGSVYTAGDLSFRVGAVPSSWTPLDVHEASNAFRDEPHRGSIHIKPRGGAIDTNTPLRALTQQLVMGTTERAYKVEEVRPFDGREALHTQLFAKLDGVPMAYDIYVASKDGCTFDFVYVAEPSLFDAGRPEFEAFVGGFHTLHTPALS